MTAPNPADNASSAPESAQDAPNGTTEGEDTGRAGQNLPREALEAELRRARDEAAKMRQRAREFGDDETYKRAKDAVAALDKAEQEKKSEVEKLTERSEGLLHRATSAEQHLAKLRVALGAGIAADQVDEFASRLRGDTDDELKADAEQLARFFAPAGPARRGDPSQGAGNDSPSASTDPLQAALENKLSLR